MASLEDLFAAIHKGNVQQVIELRKKGVFCKRTHFIAF